MRAFILALILAMASTAAHAQDADVGCGVGTEMWKGNSGIASKMAASFTNQMLFQSISITFGALGCSDGTGQVGAVFDPQLRNYAAAHFDRLASDMAEGHGESLETLARLWKIEDADRASFYRLTQQHFAQLYDADHVTVGEMLANLNGLLREDEHLHVYARS